MVIILPSQALVLNAYAVLIGATPGNAAFKEHQAFINTAGVGAAGYKAALESYASSFTTATLATNMLANLGLSTAFTQAQAVAFLNANPGNRVGAMMDLASQLYNYTGTDATLLAAKTAYVNSIDGSYAFSNNTANVNGQNLAGYGAQTLSLTTGFDNLVGSAFADTILARSLNNANTLQDGDKVDGGAGVDTLYVDMVINATAITPILTNIETVVIRAQSIPVDATNGNNLNGNTVQIDAQRSLAVDAADHVTAATGVTRWESNNSRSDVIIEDVRIGNDQKTSDVTIAMVETDPGEVDFGVYFDQQSLRNASSGSTSLTINLMDTGAAGVAATAATPLLNNPYDTFKLAINGVLTTIALDKVAVAAADTYEALLAVFNTALTGTGTTAALSGTFTITDPISGKPVTGKSIVLTGGAGIVITAPAGSGWFNTTGAAVPATSNIYTTFSTAATSVSELVTSKIVLDDVGRGSTGGDLIVGGLSVGTTSTSRGVERFEITVNDNSKLQTINSTNNALREVTIVNGATSKTVVDAYTTTVTNEGDLTVNGNVGGGTNLAGVNTYSVPTNVGGAAAVAHAGAGAAGFTDVRLIDASAFKGKLAFTAAISSDSIAKYITLVDTAANPTADVAGTGNSNFNVKGANFIYTGGNDNDTMVVTIDGAVASSRSTVVSGQSDFTFSLNGGAGDDAITLTVINPALAGGAQAWYNNQKLNANIAINGGDGNDTIRTPGAGDAIIDAGTGNDTVYTDNTGALATANATGSATAAATAYSNAAVAELAAAQAALVASNTTGFVRIEGTEANGSAFTTAALAAAALNTLNLITPVDFAVGTVPLHSALVTGITNATAAGGLTFAQNIALNAAYGNTATAGVITPSATYAGDTTLVGFTATADATVVTAAQFAAGNALLDTYIAAAKAAAATASANDTNAPVNTALLDATQLAVANASQAVNQVADPVAAVAAGTQTTVTNLTALQSALVVGATDTQVATALQAAVDNRSIIDADAATIYAVVNGGGATMIAAELATIALTLTPLITTATNLNTTAQATLAAAVTANNNAVNAAAQTAATTPAGDGVIGGNDAIGSLDTAVAQANATAALTAANAVAVTGLTAATTIQTDLAALKSAIAVGISDLSVVTLTANAVAKGTISAASKTAIDLAAGANTVEVADTVIAAEKTVVDTTITALQVLNDIDVADATLDAANLQTIINATTTANTIAVAAAASGTQSLTVAAPKAVFVFDTSNQTATYNRLTADDRNLADLKSDVNNSNNFFNSTVKVSYKGIDASMIVAGTGYKTSDLEINQALKQLINTDAVLSKLLLATDGPANTLVVTSLIDGVHTVANLAVTVTVPVAGVSSAADIAGAAAAYGLPVGSTDATVVATMVTAKTSFDTKGDYVTQLAESGAAGGNTVLTGANSTSSSDNTVTPGAGTDVIVLGTTVGTDAMTSSNEKVVYAADFGADTIVNFAATGLGIDTLDFTAINGRGTVALNSLSLDKSVVIAAEAAVPLTTVQIAALFTDSATAINHVYVAYNSTNIGSVYTVADAAGTAAGNVTATLVGTIDLADTSWASLTAANFA